MRKPELTPERFASLKEAARNAIIFYGDEFTVLAVNVAELTELVEAAEWAWKQDTWPGTVHIVNVEEQDA